MNWLMIFTVLRIQHRTYQLADTLSLYRYKGEKKQLYMQSNLEDVLEWFNYCIIYLMHYGLNQGIKLFELSGIFSTKILFTYTFLR